ncbi:MAG: transglycosylase domain-containing protein [Polyangiaceae bacterium]|nr:transglycosylase domain-containing protein [Polyangiaceae bacterium]
MGEGYGASVSIEQVRLRWGGVAMRGVDVRLREVPSAVIRLDEVDVDLGLAGKKIALRGGTVSAVGARERVIRELETWRALHPGGGGSGAGSGGRGGGTEVDGLRLVWQDRAEAPAESVTASGVQLSRVEGKTVISASEAQVSAGRATVSVKDGQVELIRSESGYRVGGLSAAALDAELALPEPVEKVSAGADRAKSPAEGGDGEIERRGAALREAVILAAKGIDAALAAGAKVDLAGVTARFRRGEERLGVGPGNLSVRRDGGALVVELSPGEQVVAAAGDEQHALTFRLRVPLSSAPEMPQEIVADLQGGPIWLSTLGVREGDLGLFDVARASIVSRARVVLSGDGESLRVDGEGKLKNLSLRSAALSEEPVAGLDLAWRAKGEMRLDGSRVDLEDGEVDLGAIRLIAKGEYRRSGGAHRVRGEFEVPLSACQSMLDSAPRGLVAKISGMRLAGSFGLKGKARFNTAQLDRDFVLDWDVSNTCRVVEVPPEVSVDRFKRAFRRQAYGPEGQRVEVEAGPGTPGWVPYGAISKFMEVAVMTTEDSGFHRHRGFDEEAIKNSIRENLRRRRFVRGASTISMQLAKNLYLERTKSVSRKLQEAVLTMYLEQELTKEQLMELYLNVVEFGPMVFGIGPAARHYFNASAAQLSLGQALYISSILPNPKVQHFAAGGALSPGWSNYLRKLMETANKRRWITDEELDEGLREMIVRGSPAPHRASPGAPPGEIGDAPEESGEGDWVGP